MIRKLRKKLIAVSMVSLCIVLFCIFGFVGILNYQKMVSDADQRYLFWQIMTERFETENDEPDGNCLTQRIPLRSGSIQPGCRFCFFRHPIRRRTPIRPQIQTPAISKTVGRVENRPTSRSQNNPPGTRKTPRSFPSNLDISLSCSTATMLLSCPPIPA